MEQPASLETGRSVTDDDVLVAAELLHEAGLTPESPRALLTGETTQRAPVPHMQALMARAQDDGIETYLARTSELAFLVNVLMSGCSVQARALTSHEASDAAIATCNLALEEWPEAARDDLVAVFERGWALLHQRISLFVADRLIRTLADVRTGDVDTDRDLYKLRRELIRHRQDGKPWLARQALEAIGTIDMAAWASLVGLLDEFPMLPAALSATLSGSTTAVSATDFKFISTLAELEDVRRFMARLPRLLEPGG